MTTINEYNAAELATFKSARTPISNGLECDFFDGAGVKCKGTLLDTYPGIAESCRDSPEKTRAHCPVCGGKTYRYV